MQIEKVRPTVFQVTIHTYELSALVAAARRVVEKDELSPEARKQLEDVLSRYDAERQRLE